MRKRILAISLMMTAKIGQAQNTLSYTEIESYYNKGIELYEKKAYAAARAQLQKYIAASQGKVNPDYFNIGNAGYYSALSGLKSHALDAEVEVGRFVISNPQHPKAKLIYSDLGDNLFNNQEYDAAIDYYKKALENRQDNGSTFDIRYQLGLSYYLLGDNRNALTEFVSVKNTVSERALDAAYYSGVINYKNENYDDAVVDFKRVENVNKYQFEVPNWITQILFKQNKFDELLGYAEPIINNPNGRKIDEITLLSAEVNFSKENYLKAAALYEKYRNFRKNLPSSQLIFRHGYALYKIDKFKEAISELKGSAIENSLIGQQSAYYLGISALKLKDLDPALAAFSTAKKQDFNKEIQEESYFNAIKILVEKNNTQTAINELRSYLIKYPNGKYVDESNELLSEIFLETSNYALAIKYIEGLNRKTSKINQAYQKLTYSQALLEYNQGEFAKAALNFEKSIKQPSDINILNRAKFGLAESNSQLKNPIAENQYIELLRSTDADISIKSKYNLGYINFNNKKYTAAQSYFRDFINLAKSSPDLNKKVEDSYLRIADCELVNKNYAEALRLYNYSYASHNIDKEYALYQKGLTLKYMDKDAESRQVFNDFANKYNDSRLIDEVLFQSGIIEMNNGNYAASVNTFTNLLRKKPNSPLVPSVLLKRALSNSNLQKNEAAITDYKLILSKYSDSDEASEALLGLKETLNNADRSEEFYDIAEGYAKSNPNAGSIEGLQFGSGKDLYFAEKYDKAIASFKSFLQKYPQSSNRNEARYLIGESYYILGNKSEAITYYSEIAIDQGNEYQVKSALRAGQLNFDIKNYHEARKNFILASESTNNQREKIVALEGAMKSNYELGDYVKCIEFADKIIADQSDVVLGATNRAFLFKGKSKMNKFEYEEAKVNFQKTISLGVDNEAAEAKYYMGYMLYKQKSFDESIKSMQELSATYSEFEYWYEKAFLLIADNYLAKNDTFMAKATLESIVANSNNESTVLAAKQKLNGIK